MSDSNKIKSDFLGIPFGTACHRLRKNILFKICKISGLNICFRCTEEITSPADLTLDHKKVWLHVDPALFWDLDNIAFSHKKCNITERPNKRWSNDSPPPDGQAWCSGCQGYKSVGDFSPRNVEKNRNRKYNAYCKQCRRK